MSKDREMEFKVFKWELKELKDNGTFSGYASVFGNIDSYQDIVEPTAFNQTIKGNRQRPLFYLHDPFKVLGLTNLKSDNYGLFTIGKFNMAVEFARDMYEFTKQGVLGAMSIGFTAIKTAMEKVKKDGKEYSIRKIQELKLYEVSLLPKGYAANDRAFITELKHRRFYGIEDQDVIEQIRTRLDDEKFVSDIKALLESEPSPDIQKKETLIQEVKKSDISYFFAKLNQEREELNQILKKEA